jgi:hypothetical protein
VSEEQAKSSAHDARAKQAQQQAEQLQQHAERLQARRQLALPGFALSDSAGLSH